MSEQQPTPTPVDGLIPTDGNTTLNNEPDGTPVYLQATVTTITEPADGILYATLTNGTGTALAILDAQDHAEAQAWIGRDTVALRGLATRVHGQPGIDLRRTAATA